MMIIGNLFVGDLRRPGRGSIRKDNAMVTGWVKRAIPAIAVIASLCSVAALGITPGVPPALAQTAGALTDAQDVNGAAGLVAEIVQCKRENDTLSIRLRLRNTGAQDVKDWRLVNGNIDQFYVVAGSKKYFVLRDSEKTPLATAFNGAYGTLDISIPKSGAYTWYAKYPAPPDEVKKVSFYSPITLPFEDVPVSQ
jgi:hypothetical protein